MKPTPGALAILSLVCAGAVGSGVWLTGMAQDCHTRWHRSGFAYEWRDWTCYVQAGSRWVPEGRVVVHVREPGATDRLATP